MNGNYPVFLEEDEELDYLPPTTLRHRHVNYGEYVLPIILHLRPLVSADHILYRILVEAEPLLEVGQLLVRRALRVNPEHLARTNLLGKPVHGLRRTSIRLEKSERDQPTASTDDHQIKRS